MWLGIYLGLSFLAACLIANLLRAKDEPIPDLIPNCLLTKYPVVFIPGPRSIFYFLKYWNEIPHFLASHGYEVFSVSLPWKGSEKRKASLAYFLNEKSKNPNEKIHLFFDQSSAPEVADLLRQNSFSCLASVTWVKTSKDQETFLNQVRGLSSPLEEIILEPDELKTSMNLQKIFWKLHLMLSNQDLTQKIETRGFHLVTGFKHLLVARAQFLAERDLIQAQSSPTL